MLSARLRNAVLTLHIAASVGPFGDSAGFLVVAIRADGATDPAAVAAAYDVVALAVATSLSVFRPGARLGSRR